LKDFEIMLQRGDADETIFNAFPAIKREPKESQISQVESTIRDCMATKLMIVLVSETILAHESDVSMSLQGKL